MWICIGIWVWAIIGVITTRVMRNVHKNKYSGLTWTRDDTAFAVMMGLFGPMGLLIIFIIEGKDCFKRRTKMSKLQKVYWDEKKQQIVTKNGECRYNLRSNAVHHQEKRIAEFEDKIRILTSTMCNTKDTSLSRRINELEKVIRRGEREVVEHNAEIDKKNTEVEKHNAEKRDKEGRLRTQLQCAAKGHGKWQFVKKDFCINRNGPEITGYFFKCANCGLEINKTEKELTAKEKEALKSLKLI